MAEVWEATDEVLTRPVAVKALLPHLAADDAFLTRFRREAVAAARLSHPHIVSIYDTCATEDCEAIVMELVRGRTLRQLLDEDGALPLRRAVDIAAQVADALDHAHANGLIHRDVKPGNILLAGDGRVLVADFGIAKAMEASTAGDLTEVGQVVGTAKYLSPEQVEGAPVTGRSDVYSLGIVLYEMLCGRPPFAGETSTATAVARLTTQPLRPRQVRAGIPRALEDITLRAMARRPEDRFATAGDLRTALEQADLSRVEEPGADPSASFDLTPVPPSLPRERSWVVPAAIIVIIAVTLGIVGVLIRRTDVGGDLFGGSDPATAVAEPKIADGGLAAFDPPPGDGHEHDGEVGLAHDGDPTTSWTTESYDRPSIDLKAGVGIAIRLTTAARVGRVTVTSPSRDWHADVYLSDAESPPTTLAGWGPKVASLDGADGAGATPSKVEAPFDARTASSVLIWITNVGATRRFELAELHIGG
jgi:hypothetical protein